MILGAGIQDIVLKRLHGVLKLAVVPACQSDLMTAHRRHRVGDLDGGVLPLQHLSGRCTQRRRRGCRTKQRQRG